MLRGTYNRIMAPTEHVPPGSAELLQAVETGVPVLRSTALELARLERDQDRISGNALSSAVLHDPFMTLRVLRYLQSHRTRSQTADITTIAHALMMLGHTRFFREFADLPVLEEALDLHPEALAAIRAGMSRSRLAALLARDWAAQRHDMDPEEVMVAALVHDVPELLATLCDPSGRAGLPAASAVELRLALFEGLGLPGLIRDLARDDGELNPRVLNVRYACDLARHCAQGWFDPAIDTDIAHVQRLLHISLPELWERVRRVVLAAAREWRFYGVRPAAAYLPLIADADGPAFDAPADPSTMP